MKVKFFQLLNGQGSSSFKIRGEEGMPLPSEELFNQLVTVVTNLRTRYEMKGYGSYDFYEDDKISIRLDTYVPNLVVWLKMPNDKDCVFSSDYAGNVRIYHHGVWEKYVAKLGEKALLAEKLVDLNREEERRRQIENDFAEIDDMVIFDEDDLDF